MPSNKKRHNPLKSSSDIFAEEKTSAEMIMDTFVHPSEPVFFSDEDFQNLPELAQKAQQINPDCDPKQDEAEILQLLDKFYNGDRELPPASRYKNKETYKHMLIQKFRRWGMIYVEKKHYSLSRPEKHLIRIDFYGTVNKPRPDQNSISYLRNRNDFAEPQMFTPFFMCNYIVSAFVRNDGDPSLAMVATLCGSLFNVVFDYIFMFPMGLGLPGAALATAVSPVLSIAICSRHFFKKSSTVRFVRQLPSPKLLAQSCQLGVSGFVGEMSSGVTTTVFNLLLLRLAGNVAVAAYGVVANYALVATAIFNGVAQGAQPLVSRCYGKNDAAGARKLLLLGSGTALALAAALYAVLFGSTGPIVAVFNSENSALMAQYAFSGMRIYFLGYFFAGFNIVAAGYLGAVDRPAEASATSLSRGIVAIVACSLVLSALFGMNGVWAAFPASEAITACLTLFLLKRKKR